MIMIIDPNRIGRKGRDHVDTQVVKLESRLNFIYNTANSACARMTEETEQHAAGMREFFRQCGADQKLKTVEDTVKLAEDRSRFTFQLSYGYCYRALEHEPALRTGKILDNGQREELAANLISYYKKIAGLKEDCLEILTEEHNVFVSLLQLTFVEKLYTVDDARTALIYVSDPRSDFIFEALIDLEVGEIGDLSPSSIVDSGGRNYQARIKMCDEGEGGGSDVYFAFSPSKMVSSRAVFKYIAPGIAGGEFDDMPVTDDIEMLLDDAIQEEWNTRGMEEFTQPYNTTELKRVAAERAGKKK
ncbi:hypothetical protein ACFL3V_05700 [Nanoarchaeota archaeon]